MPDGRFKTSSQFIAVVFTTPEKTKLNTARAGAKFPGNFLKHAQVGPRNGSGKRCLGGVILSDEAGAVRCIAQNLYAHEVCYRLQQLSVHAIRAR